MKRNRIWPFRGRCRNRAYSPFRGNPVPAVLERTTCDTASTAWSRLLFPELLAPTSRDSGKQIHSSCVRLI